MVIHRRKQNKKQEYAYANEAPNEAHEEYAYANEASNEAHEEYAYVNEAQSRLPLLWINLSNCSSSSSLT